MRKTGNVAHTRSTLWHGRWSCRGREEVVHAPVLALAASQSLISMGFWCVTLTLLIWPYVSWRLTPTPRGWASRDLHRTGLHCADGVGDGAAHRLHLRRFLSLWKEHQNVIIERNPFATYLLTPRDAIIIGQLSEMMRTMHPDDERIQAQAEWMERWLASMAELEVFERMVTELDDRLGMPVPNSPSSQTGQWKQPVNLQRHEATAKKVPEMMWPSDWVRPSAELVARLSRLDMLLLDVDGVLTDGTVLRGADGTEARRFSVIDGHGLGMLRDDGMIVGVVSREDSAITRARMEKLRMPEIHVGANDKAVVVADIRARRGLGEGTIAFVGDDLPDMAAFKKRTCASLQPTLILPSRRPRTWCCAVVAAKKPCGNWPKSSVQPRTRAHGRPLVLITPGRGCARPRPVQGGTSRLRCRFPRPATAA